MPTTIKEGSQSQDVSTWQSLLSAAGFPVDVTGIFDAATDAATRAWQAAKGIGVDGEVGPTSWTTMTGVVSVPPDPKAEFGRNVLLSVWKDVTGEDPNLSELQFVGGNAKLESNYGLYPYTNKLTGETSGVINNWGAVQAHGDQPGFETTDTHADGTQYNALYRIYKTPEDGARDMLKEMTTRRPTAWALFKQGDIDGAVAAMRAKDPISKAYGYFEQSVESRASTLVKNIAAIASALNEPIAAQRGGPLPGGGIPYPPPADLTPAPGGTGGEAGGAAGWTIGAAVAAAIAAAAYYFRRKWWPF